MFLSHSLEPITGADIIASTTFPMVPGKPLNYKWEGHGLKLSIPEDALDPDTPSLTMSIQASLSGQYQLPDNMELVSGIYWITSSQKISLKAPATLKLQHCACVKHPEQLTSLSFITARHGQNTLPYMFRKLPGGTFSNNYDLGSIELSHFCGLGVSKEKAKEEEEKKLIQKFCVVRIYYIPKTVNQWLTDFVVVWNLKLFLKVLKV